jgi:hypothetical protein
MEEKRTFESKAQNSDQSERAASLTWIKGPIRPSVMQVTSSRPIRGKHMDQGAHKRVQTAMKTSNAHLPACGAHLPAS